MSAGAFVLLSAIVAIMLAVIGLIVEEARNDYSNVPVSPSRPRLVHVAARQGIEQPPVTISHAVPDRAITLGEAHAITQDHRLCVADECPRKLFALGLLIKTGRMVPDTRGILWARR